MAIQRRYVHHNAQANSEMMCNAIVEMTRKRAIRTNWPHIVEAKVAATDAEIVDWLKLNARNPWAVSHGVCGLSDPTDAAACKLRWA